MYSTRLFILTVILTSALLAVSVFAVEEAAQTVQVAGKPADAQYPFIAEVVGTDVYVRSGNSTADYPCTKVNTPDKVTVVDEEYGWAKILPPDGCYSWIYKAYVKINSDNPTVGVLTHDNVRVWAGADSIESGSSSGLQTKLNKGEIVDLFADQPETGDYYKIKSPTGAHLWISANYLKYVSPLKQDKPIVVPPRPDTQNGDPLIPPSGEQKRPEFTNLNGQSEETQPPVVVEIQQEEEKVEEPKEEKPPQLTTKETELLKQCYDLSAKIDEELKKPLNEQDYTKIKAPLEKIIQQDDAGKAVAYAHFLTNRIGRFELAKSVNEEVAKQEKQLERAKENIEKAHQAQLQQVPEEVNYLYTGTLKPSHVYTGKSGQKRYLLMDSNGKILCYVVAVSPEIDAQLMLKQNTTIGINGSVISNQKSLVALVAVTELVSIQ